MAITFKDRVSENPNRRKLTVVSSTNGEIQIADEIVVDVERDEGTITEQGTLFSANNMNTLMAADAVIRNQNEFDALVGQFHATIGSSDPAVIAACPKTIVLVGGGGNSPNGAYTVPLNGINLPWVKTGYFHLQGINGAKLYWDCTGVSGERAAINGGVDSIDDADGTFLIENIKIEFSNPTIKRAYGFNNCTNLTNCTGTGTGNGDGYGFYSCTNLTNCTGTGYGYGSGFYSCTNLTNCTGTGTGTGTGNGSGSGFYSCTNLTNCTGTGTGTGTGYGYGFRECNNLTNCTGTGTGTGTGYGYGFYNCTRASNCKDGGSSTNMWHGTNTGIDPVTCKKIPDTADNSALNS